MITGDRPPQAEGGTGVPGPARRVLLVVPTATGGLAAHVRMEEQVLGQAGVPVARAAVDIGARPSLRQDVRSVHALRHVFRAPRDDRPVTVHAHGLRAGGLAALARGTRGRRQHGVRLVVTLHNRIAGSAATRAVGRLLLRRIAACADVVLTVSPDLAAQVREVTPRSRRPAATAARAGRALGSVGRTPVRIEHAVVPAPPDPRGLPGATGPRREDRPGPPAGPGDPMEILVVARLAPQKGLDVLLDAVGRSAGTGPARHRIHVTVAGDGPEHDALQRRITEDRLPVTLLGASDQVPALLARADLVVSAARWEGQPVFLQEALRAGRAIVATDVGGTALVTGQAAVLVPAEDPGALAAAIDRMQDRARREAARRASRARARRLPGPHALRDQLQDVLDLGHDGRTGPGPVGPAPTDDRL